MKRNLYVVATVALCAIFAVSSSCRAEEVQAPGLVEVTYPPTDSTPTHIVRSVTMGSRITFVVRVNPNRYRIVFDVQQPDSPNTQVPAILTKFILPVTNFTGNGSANQLVGKSTAKLPLGAVPQEVQAAYENFETQHISLEDVGPFMDRINTEVNAVDDIDRIQRTTLTAARLAYGSVSGGSEIAIGPGASAEIDSKYTPLETAYRNLTVAYADARSSASDPTDLDTIYKDAQAAYKTDEDLHTKVSDYVGAILDDSYFHASYGPVTVKGMEVHLSYSAYPLPNTATQTSGSNAGTKTLAGGAGHAGGPGQPAPVDGGVAAADNGGAGADAEPPIGGAAATAPTATQDAQASGAAKTGNDKASGNTTDGSAGSGTADHTTITDAAVFVVKGYNRPTFSAGTFFTDMPNPTFFNSGGKIAETKGRYEPVLGALAHTPIVYLGSDASITFSFGAGLRLNDTTEPQYLIGLSYVLGRSQRTVITAGWVGGRITELQGYKVGDTAPSGSIPTHDNFKTGHFVGISYDF